MAEITQDDTHPPLRGAASDETGLLNLTTASSLTVILRQKVTTGVPTQVVGPAVAIQPPEADAGGKLYNWRHLWAAGESAVPGDYDVMLKAIWDAAAVPPKVQYFPMGVLTIKPKIGP